GLRCDDLGADGERRPGGYGARSRRRDAALSQLCRPRHRHHGGGHSRRLYAGAHGGGGLAAVRAGTCDPGRTRNEQALRQLHLCQVRISRRIQLKLQLRRTAAARPMHSRIRVGRWRLPGHRPGRDLHDDRELPQRHDLAGDAHQCLRPDRLAARRLLRRLAHRSAMKSQGPPARWRGMVLLLAFAAASLLASCRSSPTGDTVLKFWAMGREGEVVVQLLPEFERTHPGIRVEVQQLPWTAAHEKLLTAFAGDATPDLCQLGNTWVPEFVALGAIAPLDRYVAASPVVDAADYFSGIWQTNSVGAALYGVPWYVDTRLLFCRRDLLAQAGYASPPASWPEWTQMMAAIKQRAGPDRYAILVPLNEADA